MDISQYITPVSGIQYYIAMLDFGRGRGKPSGFGADVCPEYTRRQIVEEIRDWIVNGRQIVHVKLVTGNDLVDVTEEILTEALALAAADEAEMLQIDAINDRIAAERDHARSLRKEFV